MTIWKWLDQDWGKDTWHRRLLEDLKKPVQWHELIPELTGGSLQMQHWHLNREFPVGLPSASTTVKLDCSLLSSQPTLISLFHVLLLLPSFLLAVFLFVPTRFVSLRRLNNECALSGRPFSFSRAPKWPPSPSASHPQPLYYFLLSRILLPSSHWWNWPSCYDSPAPFLFDICGLLCLFLYVLWGCKMTQTHTPTPTLDLFLIPTLIISLMCSDTEAPPLITVATLRRGLKLSVE